MADGHIRIDTRLDNSKIKGDLKELENLVKNGAEDVTEEFALEVEKLNARWAKLEAQQAKNNAKMNEYKESLESVTYLQSEIEGLKLGQSMSQQKLDSGSLNEAGRVEARIDIADAQKEIDRLQSALDKLDAVKLKNDLKTTEASAKGIELSMNKVGIDARKLSQSTKSTGVDAQKLSQSTKSVEVSTRQTNNNVQSMSKGMGKGVKTLAKYAGMLLGVRAIYGGIQKAVNAWMSSTQEGAQAQADLAAIWSSLGNTLAPVIQWLISGLKTILGYANAITKAFFGFELFSKGTTKNLGGAVKQAKELRKQLAGFDEANVLGDNGQQNLSGGAGGITPSEIGIPDITGFKQAIDQLKKWLDSIWNSDIVKSYWDSIQTIVMARVEMIKSILLNIWDNVLLSWNEMLPFLEVGFWNMIEYWRRVLEDIAIVSDKWFPIITESINTFIDSIFETFRPLTTFISRVWSDFTQIMLDIWNDHGLPILDEIMRFIDGMIQLFDLIWTKIIDPIIKPAIEMMSGLWDEHLKGLVKDFGSMVAELIKGALEIWNEVINPIITWIVEKLSPIVSWLADKVFTKMGTSIGKVADRIREAINIIRGIFGGLIDFIVGVFTGDWDRAWNGVIKIFERIWDGLRFVFKGPINALIDGVNWVIRQLNKIKIPDWVPSWLGGGKGINFTQIPRLARGGITTGATTAIIGEAGREAVVPLQNNTGWAKDFLNVLDSYGGFGGNSNQPQVIQLIVDKKVLAQVVNDSNEDNKFATNGGFNYVY